METYFKPEHLQRLASIGEGNHELAKKLFVQTLEHVHEASM